ncbi:MULTISPECIES: M6 family metalloprotease domain-containing protein [unclassified Fibrobacter]|uniref:M6 family metalloprotease domain-containing protein n=1 Tax=unclassified Fibrobacter TaxID=2634177 RepID=UPI000D6C83E6|nr:MULTISPECIES: M6 family metalloprotease domain-containing protein [unclassified Fibrobacter]PWJ71912.1 M6 family metalloprotease-like protein [Fibrobacter sp. UWR4]PZW70362.1 M6 family metalloprotease-like protein [Fibrobacter sp. UWR1]
MVSLKKLMAGGFILALCGNAFADIVYQGKRMQSWPADAITKFDNSRGSNMRFAPPKEVSHYSAPKGKIYGLTLLVDFSDQPAPVTVDEVSDWLNKEGFNRDGCKGSVRDYYLDVSNGQLDFTNEVFGWYRAKYPKSYYEGLDGYSGSDVLVKEVFEYFDSKVDYSRYDNDKNGVTEAINIVYAGEGQTWGQGLWPHAGWSNETRDGVRLQNHQMTDMPGKFSIYVFVHECGHMIFGWPDLYWYGDYCTMGNRANDWNPIAINDFYRADQGWIPFVDVSAEDIGKASSEAGEKCYRFKNPNRPDKEGLAWSYVKNTGRNATLKGNGILMQHYDFSIDGNSSANKLGLRIVHADSKGKTSDPENDQWPSPGSRATAFFSGTYNAFSDALYPAIRWYSGAETGLNFTDVNVNGSTLSFCLGGNCTVSFDDGNSGSSDEPMTITEISFTADLSISDDYAPVSIDLQGSKVAEILGIKESEIASKASFYAVEPDSSLNSNTTGEGTGHWFDAKGSVVTWNTNGTSIVFSNVDLSTMTTKVGHMPGKVKAGDKFTFRQALVYGNKQATLAFNITIKDDSTAPDSSADSSTTAIVQLHQSTLDLARISVQYFDMNGNLLTSKPTQAGNYLMRIKKNGKAISQSVIRIK